MADGGGDAGGAGRGDGGVMARGDGLGGESPGTRVTLSGAKGA